MAGGIADLLLTPTLLGGRCRLVVVVSLVVAAATTLEVPDTNFLGGNGGACKSVPARSNSEDCDIEDVTASEALPFNVVRLLLGAATFPAACTADDGIGALIRCGCSGGATVDGVVDTPTTVGVKMFAIECEFAPFKRTHSAGGTILEPEEGADTQEAPDDEELHEEYASKLLPWLIGGAAAPDWEAADDEDELVAVEATEADGDECTLPIIVFLTWRGDECGLCFSVLDKVLLSACSDEVAILKSPKS